ncbi:alpha/beta hydrolase [Nocardioides sp. dk4132]|uniref:alpha/beta hydrolase n=1 Tax=unclassified Nocardioides TaxID=2615069 RepID=UPI00129636DC|nr:MULTISPECIES: alpha/beta hydrolase [unclassified Nocardioides]MQW77591.1 alpha/beta hydrolase [Nocardioides sp. dk4132]QGA06119.1 alpha/beta hydrolase [Nocardioides sp. dk884]
MPIEIHELRVPTPGPAGQPWELAATVFLPAPSALPAGPNLLALIPGAGYSRGYFNLPVPGASQAMYHAGRGNIIVTIDPLGAGDSSPAQDATAADAAAALDAAVHQVVGGLGAGTLIPGLGPVAIGATAGVGHSLGGHLVTVTQAEHGTFKGVGLLGCSVLGTRFPLAGGGSTDSPAEADFTYAFHWGSVPEVDPTAEPTDLASLAGIDVALGLPVRHDDAPWVSRSIPGYVSELLGASAVRAGDIEAEVLLAVGDRDVTHPIEEEAAAFASAHVDTFVLRESAHQHNFAATSEELWKVVDTFVHHSSTFDRRVQSTEFAGRFQAATEDEAE